MLVKVTSKGQRLIPESMRKTLGLGPRVEVEVQVNGRKIIIEPVEHVSPIEALYGKYPKSDFRTDLEAEHWQDAG